MVNMRHRTKFVVIGPATAKIRWFWHFQNGGRRRLEFLKCQNFNGRKDKGGQTVYRYQILCPSVKWLLRYGDFGIFQDGGRRHFLFSNCPNLNGRKNQKGQTASPYQILWWSVKQLRRYGDFSIY